MSYIITRRRDDMPEPAAYTELRRAPTLAAARRVAVEVAYRFFEAADLLGDYRAQSTITDIMAWDGGKPIIAITGGTRLTVAAI